MSTQVLTSILRQVNLARAELSEYKPTDLNWPARCESMVRRVVPWLNQEATALAEFVTQVMNSPAEVRRAAETIVTFLQSLAIYDQNKAIHDQIASLNASLDHEKLLLSNAGGAEVSKLIERFLIERATDWMLESNGASDYPDLFLRSEDYSALPEFRRGKNQVFGAALKGKSKRAVRVPDGLEVKTCRRRFAVDCHHAHVGLHIVMIFDRNNSIFEVTDILLGFMRQELYRITVPSSPTTTLKASFNGREFVSILNKPV